MAGHKRRIQTRLGVLLSLMTVVMAWGVGTALGPGRLSARDYCKQLHADALVAMDYLVDDFDRATQVPRNTDRDSNGYEELAPPEIDYKIRTVGEGPDGGLYMVPNEPTRCMTTQRLFTDPGWDQRYIVPDHIELPAPSAPTSKKLLRQAREELKQQAQAAEKPADVQPEDFES